MKKVLKIVGDIICYGIIIALIIFSVLFVKSTRLNEMPSIAGYSMYVVKTGSMAPTIDPGSLIVVKKVNANTLKKGDIVTFKGAQTGNLFTHRIYKVEKGKKVQFLTKGDANESIDPMTSSSKNIVGKLVFSVPHVGVAITFIQDNWPLVILLTLGTLILITLLKKFFTIDKNEKESGGEQNEKEKN
ncbi:signal peptidase I [Eubacterium multiforme]|uniref:Signal peptidase I n=1 Tax=Eubacterium multiforme TaxID=83339 RepID=A0ABT9UVE1_9FIRM|nr:signal peptidase I [Eubacterium multiforme]MDQ0150278.1 signal peptidase [Eubacterium multiforme]